tara:strand:+ start:800 stop:2233 length:1434 start_codon:yes stop_codon:yes gene_type:complete
MDSYVGPYQVLRLVDRGGQGSVYLGWDERLQRKVAIKIHDLPGQRAERKALLREARLVAQLDSPRIVQVYDVIESASHLAMVMEYVPGCSLRELLDAVRPTLASSLTVAVDVAGALAIARQNRVLHCDLKPANVLIAENGHAKLTDFGISRPTADGRLARPGSPSAMSPEQYTGEPMDARSDLFSLGALMYHMLSGVHPYMHDGSLDVARLLGGRARPLREVLGEDSDLPEPLLDLVDQLLNRNPDQRPRNTRQVRQVLRAVMRDIPLAAHRTLRRESRPCFRPERPEDLPLLVPKELGRDARSRLPPSEGGRPARMLHWLRGTRRPMRAALTLGVLGILVIPAGVGMRNATVPVRFDEPVMRYDVPTTLPGAFSTRWLVNELKQAVAGHVGPLQVLGNVGAEPRRVVYSSNVRLPPEPLPEHEFSLTVHCLSPFCLVSLGRAGDGMRHSAQAVVPHGSTLEDWRSAVRSAAAALFL